MSSETRRNDSPESAERYETLVNNLALGVYRNTPGATGHFLEANPAMVAMFEADSKEEFLMHNVSDLYQNPAERSAFVEKITSAGSVKNEELALVTLKGKKIIASVSAVMKKFDNGDVYFDGVIEDITERKQLERQLKDARDELEKRVSERTEELNRRVTDLEQARQALINVLEDLSAEKTKVENAADDLKKFKLAVDNASDHVVITSPDGTVIYVNPAVEKITGYTPQEVVGNKAGRLWGNLMERSYYQHLWETIKTQKKTFSGEMTNKRKNGQLYNVAVTISPILDEDGSIIFYVGVERDITKEKEIDKAKSEFISLASHQMRTPLTAINWYTEMLLDGDAGQLNEKQTEYFQEIYRADRRMNEIVKSFIHILSLETGTLTTNPVAVNIAEVVHETLQDLKLAIDKKHINVGEQFGESLPVVKIDPELIRVILQNLISNAVKYTPEKGDITITLRGLCEGDTAEGKVASQNCLLVTVKDTGMGISAIDRDKIFVKFFRTDSAKKWDPDGNGLGLYMSKIMMDIVGGTIWFVSEEGKGTTFCAFLPLEQKKLV
jgi:PAS domain S-box-containing protein